jgi:phosphoribosylformimino-5-aminoimidazole carboxamide ribotide isomerase
MIIPCIDLQGGRAVQLVRGRRRALAVRDVLGLLVRFRGYPILHVIDLDAAMRRGTNARWIKLLCRRANMKVRVGGGIRTAARARRILSWGAEKIIVGSAAFRNGRVARDFLKRLVGEVGRKKVIVALDTEGGWIVVRGWRERLKLQPEDVIPELEPFCSEFLSTFVDNEGARCGPLRKSECMRRWEWRSTPDSSRQIRPAVAARPGNEIRRTPLRNRASVLCARKPANRAIAARSIPEHADPKTFVLTD